MWLANSDKEAVTTPVDREASSSWKFQLTYHLNPGFEGDRLVVLDPACPWHLFLYYPHLTLGGHLYSLHFPHSFWEITTTHASSSTIGHHWAPFICLANSFIFLLCCLASSWPAYCVRYLRSCDLSEYFYSLLLVLETIYKVCKNKI